MLNKTFNQNGTGQIKLPSGQTLDLASICAFGAARLAGPDFILTDRNQTEILLFQHPQPIILDMSPAHFLKKIRESCCVHLPFINVNEVFGGENRYIPGWNIDFSKTKSLAAKTVLGSFHKSSCHDNIAVPHIVFESPSLLMERINQEKEHIFQHYSSRHEDGSTANPSAAKPKKESEEDQTPHYERERTRSEGVTGRKSHEWDRSR